MALRYIDVIVPLSQVDSILQLAADQAVIDAWHFPLAEEGYALVRMLAPITQTETLVDLVNGQSASAAGFRIMVVPVEAALPRPEASSNQTSSGESNQSAQTDSRRETRISREELYEDVSQGTNFSIVYTVSVVLATLVAAIGLIRDDVAIIIGAMVIAPLLGPNVAFALATTLGDRDLAMRAVTALGAGFLITVGLSASIGVFVGVDPGVPAIAARTTVTLDQLALALAAGSAGTLAVTTGVPAALIGVMVAVALLPPLVTAGLLFGAGNSFLGLQALVLFAGNIICVNLAGVLTFLVQGVRPRNWWDAERARTASRLAIMLWIVLLSGLCVIIVWARLP